MNRPRAVPEDFDFEYWMELAQNDPEAFEQQRKELIQHLIDSQSEEDRLSLKQLQWRIDSVRFLSANPLDACLRIYEMLMKKTFGDQGLARTLAAANDNSGFPDKRNPPSSQGKTLVFRKFQDQEG